MKSIKKPLALIVLAGFLAGCTYNGTTCGTGNCGYLASINYVPTTGYVKRTVYVPTTNYVSYVPSSNYISTSNCCSANCCPTCTRCGYDYGYSLYDVGWY